MSIDVLRSYLVQLGFKTDEGSFGKFKQDLDKATQFVQGHTSGMAKSYVGAAGIIASALASVGIATISLLNKIAQSDLEYQKFGMRMYMGRDAAKEMKIALDALGESMEDVAWNPELRKQYFALTKQERGMATPKDAQAQLKYLRDIRFEFTRLQVEATYGMQHVGYYLFKYLEGPIKRFREGMGKMNDWLTAHMPEWSEKIAKWMTIIINIGGSAWRFLSNVFDILMRLWNLLPGWGKTAALVLTVAFAPISPALKILGAALLLLDDFFAYIDGRKSSTELAPVWWALVQVIEFINDGLRDIVGWLQYLDNFFGGNDSELKAAKKITFTEIIENIKSGKPGEGNPAVEGLQRGVQNYRGMTGAALTPALAGGTSNSSVNTVNFGDVKIDITQPNATPKQIAESVKVGIREAMGKANARNTREAAGVYK